ncbi:MAG: zinc ABC transporter substrate-binding protein [Demequinaceae bacterium]|nr:zinc ABC transporter substrate-binding protein [Demequinaceae bacterium]
MSASFTSRATLIGVLALGLAACAPADEPTPSSAPALTVAAAFYPLEYVAERIGGDDVEVIALTPPGAEPHDLELSPSGVREVRDADIVLYLSGFQPKVDDAISATEANGFDVSDVVPLIGGGEGHVGTDPHFWLDPVLLSQYSEAVTDRFVALDPDHADLYRANSAILASDLADLDTLYAESLTGCERDTILVSHEAFGYLSLRYGLTQVGLSGINPEAEPSPARIREVRDLAESVGATTVFVETLVDPSVVEAFAYDAGLAVATLDPIGGLVEDGDDYLIIMNRNLAVLMAGLGCD